MYTIRHQILDSQLQKYKHPYKGEKDTYTIVPAFQHFKLKEIFPFHQSVLKAVQFCKIFRKGKERIGLHSMMVFTTAF